MDDLQTKDCVKCFVMFLLFEPKNRICSLPFLRFHISNESTVTILYTLKTSENLWFSGVFRGCKIGKLVRNGLIEY